MLFFFDPMSLITPELGYAFWTTLAFVIFWFILGKFAFKPIVNSIESRNEKIAEELAAAKNARMEFESLKSEKENMEREAREARNQMIAEAKAEVENFRMAEMTKAKEEASKLLELAKSEINTQKVQALLEVKKEVSALSISIAEKLLKEKLNDSDSQKKLIEKLVAEA